MDVIVVGGSVSAELTCEGDVRLDAEVDDRVAEVNGSFYPTLSEALRKAPDGATVTLLRDATGDSLTVPAGRSLTLNLDGHTYRVSADDCGLTIPADSGLILLNGEMTSADVQMPVKSTGELTLTDVELSGGSTAVLSVWGGHTYLRRETDLTASDGADAVSLHGDKTALTVKFDESFSGLVTGGILVSRAASSTCEMKLNIYGNGRFTDQPTYTIPYYLTPCTMDLSGWHSMNEFSALTGQANKLVLFIGDGMGENHIRNTQLCYGGGMYMDSYTYRGYVTTDSSNSYHRLRDATDSAAGGSALATGYKYINGELAWHNGENVTSICEKAKAAGLGVAVITTDYLSGATPAAFSAHAHNREYTEEIIASQVVGCADLLMGWSSNAYRNARSRFEAAGFSWFTSMSTLNMDAPRLIATFDTVIAENGTDTCPTLSMLSAFAVEYMEKHFPNGYIIMIEGAHIDRCSEFGQLDEMMKYLRDFDLSIETVSEMLKGQTGVALLITADHETGGLKLAQTRDQLTNSLYSITTHTRANVPYFIRLQIEAEVPYGFFPPMMDNTDICRLMYSLLGL